MTIEEREQVVKDLQKIVDNYSGSWKRYDVLANALALIKELAEENDYLKQQNEIYETLNKKLEDACESYAWTYGTSISKELFLKKERENTVKEMQSMIKEECLAGGIYPAFVARVVENVGKKLLEGKNDV